MYLNTYFSESECACVRGHGHGGPRTALGSPFSPSTTWGSGDQTTQVVGPDQQGPLSVGHLTGPNFTF